jgi:hypothetical protein
MGDSLPHLPSSRCGMGPSPDVGGALYGGYSKANGSKIRRGTIRPNPAGQRSIYRHIRGHARAKDLPENNLFDFPADSRVNRPES